MTTKLISIPAADLDSLRQIRSVIADAVGHPAREVAIAAIDRMAAAPDVRAVKTPRLQAADYCSTCSALHTATELNEAGRCKLCVFMDAARTVRNGHYSIATRMEYADRQRFDAYNEAFDRLEGDGETVQWYPSSGPPVPAGGPMIPALQLGHMENASAHGLAVVNVQPTVLREPSCGAPMCVGHVRTGTATACEAGRHHFRWDSASATISIASDHRCLCGAVTYGEAGQFEER